jgi:hypothetical protein
MCEGKQKDDLRVKVPLSDSTAMRRTEILAEDLTKLYFSFLNVFFTFVLGHSVNNKFLFTMMAYPDQSRTTLGQLCAALWDSQSQPDVTQPG